MQKIECGNCKCPCVAKGSENWEDLCPLIADEKQKLKKVLDAKKAMLRKVESIPYPRNLTLNEIISIIKKDIERYEG